MISVYILIPTQLQHDSKSIYNMIPSIYNMIPTSL